MECQKTSEEMLAVSIEGCTKDELLDLKAALIKIRKPLDLEFNKQYIGGRVIGGVQFDVMDKADQEKLNAIELKISEVSTVLKKFESEAGS